MQVLPPISGISSAEQSIELLKDLLAIPGPSGQEGRVIEYLKCVLHSLGIPESAMVVDDANKSSPFGGEVGNLIVDLPGDLRLPRRLFVAHCDTVPLCVGSQPVRDGRYIVSANPATGLGADNRTGVAVLLNLAVDLLRTKGKHPPITLFWTVQEEVGMQGVRFVNTQHLRNPKLAFNFDGGRAGKLTVGATGCYRMTMKFTGKAVHAALRPEEGINAITAAAMAVHAIHAAGMLGRIGSGNEAVTTNIGVVEGGNAVNVVPDRVIVRAEVRGHDPVARQHILNHFCQTAQDAVCLIRNATGEPATVHIDSHLDYEAFRLDANEPCIIAAEDAIRATGLVPIRAITGGGIDANWMYANGIPVVSLGAGQVDGHTFTERVDLAEFEAALHIANYLAVSENVSNCCEVGNNLYRERRHERHDDAD
ncbi:MAG: M20/M25/M40 family metallo-hydrolase [Planctomycetaceae bacterium]|nr:M20/M25/M40 family metallo-hydrolase [Planctomycetaceae bacterium]